MIRRSILMGLVGGLLIGLAGTYPLLNILAPIAFTEWVRPVQNETVHSLLLMFSAVLMSPPLLALGIFAAHKAKVHHWREGLKSGAIAGMIAGILCYYALLLPINTLIAYSGVIEYLVSMNEAMALPGTVLMQYSRVFTSGAYWVELGLMLLILFWAGQGAIVGWRRQKGYIPPQRPSLYEIFSDGRHPRHWFDEDESASKAGLIVGVLLGTLVVVLSFSAFGTNTATGRWIDIINQGSEYFNQNNEPMFNLGTILSPLAILGLLLYGAIVVLLIKNPPNFFIARFKGIFVASLAISLLLFLVVLRGAYFFFGLAPFIYLKHGQVDPDYNQIFMQVQSALSDVSVSTVAIMLVLLLPWLVLFIAMIFALVMSLLQQLTFGLIIPLLHKRPVDKAMMLQWRIRREPNEILPLIYGLFKHSPDAYDVLVHLAIKTYKQEPHIAQLAAAYHTIGNQTRTVADFDPPIHGIQQVLDAQSNWRWSRDVGIIYNALHDILEAKTLDQILQLNPLPAQSTTSLPPSMMKAVDMISKSVFELHKVERVDDLPTKLIFLENSLQTIHDAQRFVDGEIEQPNHTQAVLPEMVAMSDVLDHWQGVVLTAVKHIKGRADVCCNLQTNQVPYTTHLPVSIAIENNGLNVAQEVRIKLLPSEDYQLNEERESWIDILSPGENKQIDLTILPIEGMPRARVTWELTYDDAVDANRRLEFADIVEFTLPDKQFERIFPIPYVTGTPLKTNDVFVGRQDVFDFIRENLVGVHQNNVIILHGQRRTGKTSVLYRLGEVMRDTHYGVLIDMQGKPARGELDFLYSIADDIVFALEDHDIEIDLPDRAEFEAAGPEFYFRSRFLRSLAPHLNGKNLLLMFDEFEELQRRVEDGRLQPEIFQFLRNLMQHNKQADFVFSGTHKLEELGAEYWSVLFNIAAYKPITFLSANDMRRLILEPVADYPIEYDPIAIDRNITVTAGHPYFAQLVLHEAIVYHNETQRNYLTVNDINHILERIVERGEAHFKYIWAESSEEERLVLQGMTELLVGTETVKTNKLHDFLAERGYESDNQWQTALASLEGRDILTRQTAKSPFYRFKVDLIRLWIDRTRPAL